MEFLNKEYFILILVIPIIIYLVWLKYKKNSINFKFTEDLEKVFKYWKIKFWWKLILLASILLSFILILANPNKSNIEEKIKKNGIDIVFLLDVSQSMNAEDLKPTRIDAAKNILWNFLDKLKTDRVWLVIFAWKPFTSLPLTFDYQVVKETLKDLSTDTINQENQNLNWTAIWDAILMWKNLFKNWTWDNLTWNNIKREKIMILLTDGDANKWIDPILAAEYAKKYWIKIYTIWIGSKRWWYITYQVWPFTQRAQIPPLKEETLRKIAQITNWKFYRATDNYTLYQIFQDLAKLTKTDIETKVKKTYTPYYLPFAYLIIILLGVYSFTKIKEI